MWFLTAVALAGASIPANVELYSGLKSGMTKPEADASLPEKERFLTSSCQMLIKKVYEGGRLTSVILRNKWKMEKNDCYQPILVSLVEKYGRSDEVGTVPAVGSIIPPGVAEIWIEGQRVIALTRRGDDTVLAYRTKVLIDQPEKAKGL